jgi:hypothetical protein
MMPKYQKIAEIIELTEFNFAARVFVIRLTMLNLLANSMNLLTNYLEGA